MYVVVYGGNGAQGAELGSGNTIAEAWQSALHNYCNELCGEGPPDVQTMVRELAACEQYCMVLAIGVHGVNQ